MSRAEEISELIDRRSKPRQPDQNEIDKLNKWLDKEDKKRFNQPDKEMVKARMDHWKKPNNKR